MHPTLNVKRFGDANGFLSDEHFRLCGTRNSLDVFGGLRLNTVRSSTVKVLYESGEAMEIACVVGGHHS